MESSQIAGPVPACATACIAGRIPSISGTWTCPVLAIRRTRRGKSTSSGGRSAFRAVASVEREDQGVNPEASYIANDGRRGAERPRHENHWRARADIIRRPARARWTGASLDEWKNGKEYRATLGRKPIAGIFSVGIEDENRWKDSVQNGDEIRMWVVDGMANGLRPWFTKFNAKPIDRRWLPVVEELYTWHYRNERYLRNESPQARVAMVYSQQTAMFYGGEKSQAKVEEPALGFYQALVEARIPFEMVHDGLLDSEHLKPFRTLILPNIAALSGEQCHQITSFVKQGGSVVATYETSLYDQWGVRRSDFGLADLFGVSFDGRLEGPKKNSYLRLNKDPSTGQFHPLLAGLEDATRIINGVNRVIVKPAMPSSYAPLTVVPSYPDLPMEEVFPRPIKSLEAGVFLREIGDGRVAYFPWDLDRTFWDVLARGPQQADS